MRQRSFIVGIIEALGLVAFAGSIVFNANRDHSTVGSPTVQAIIYVLFGVGIALISMAQLRGKSWPRTPYLLIQLFAFIVAYTLASGTGVEARMVGATIAVLAMTGFYTAWRD